MSSSMTCPRCGSVVRPPNLWSDTWNCSTHGAIAPVRPAFVASGEAIQQTAQRSQVPVWLPWPLPLGWLVTGLRWAGDDHTGPVATVLACSGPNPLALDTDDERSADLLLVAEQPGVGLGAHLAGLPDVDPGTTLAEGRRADLRLVAAGHETPLWSVSVDGAAAYVGEALGVWLWVIAWPAAATVVLLEQFELRDVRDPGHVLDLPVGALSPRML